MKRVLLLALAVTLSLGLMQGEGFAKNNKRSDAYESPAAERGRGRGSEAWQELSPDQRRELQQRYQKFREMSPEEQQRLRQRYERFRELSPERRQQMKERHERLQQLSPQQREELYREWRQLKELPPEQRSRRRQELRREYFNGNDRGRESTDGPGNGRGRRD